MPIFGLEPHSLFTKDTGNKRSSTWAAERNMSILGLEPHSLFPKDTGNAPTTTLAAERKMPILGLEKTVYFRRLLATRVQLPGLQKEICRYRDSNQHILFPKAIANTLSTTWAAETKMPILGLEPHSLLPKATGNTRSTTWAAERNTPLLRFEKTQFISEGYCQHAFNNRGCRKKYADIGIRTNTVYFRRLLATRVQLSGTRKKYGDIGTRTNTVFFSKATENPCSTTWAAERIMPVLRLVPTQFISEGY